MASVLFKVKNECVALKKVKNDDFIIFCDSCIEIKVICLACGKGKIYALRP